MNFLQIGRISLLSVAENIMTCLPWGVLRNISCTSLRISGMTKRICCAIRLMPKVDFSWDDWLLLSVWTHLWVQLRQIIISYHMSLSKSIIIKESDPESIKMWHKLTQLLQHFVALIKDEMFQVLQVQFLVADESKNAAWCADNNVRCQCFQALLVLLDWHSSEENWDLDCCHVLAESFVLLADLESEFTSVTHDQNVDLIVSRLQLLKRGQDEDCRLSHTWLGLAQNIHAKNSLRNAFVLNWERSLEYFLSFMLFQLLRRGNVWEFINCVRLNR